MVPSLNNLPDERNILSKYVLGRKLGQGTYGTIYSGWCIETGKAVAIKVENAKSSASAQLETEVSVYTTMRNARVSRKAHWPHLHSYGKDGVKSVLVMDLLGDNLETVLKMSSQRARQPKLSPEFVAYLAIKMISLIETLHQHGFVHRDLKPQNFVLQPNHNLASFPELFVIDFGLARQFITESPEGQLHVAYDEGLGFQGTLRFASVNTQLGVPQTRRDDLQTIGYIIVYLALGRLPWQDKTRNMEKKLAQRFVRTLKMSTSAEKLSADLPQSLRDSVLAYLLYVNSLMYHEAPDYDFCRSMFLSCARTFSGKLA